MAIIMMMTWLEPMPASFTEGPGFDIIEFYAGRGRISRIGRAVGFQAVTADLIYDKPENPQKSALNLCGSAGFAPPGLEDMHTIYRNPRSLFKCGLSLRLAVLMILAGNPEGALGALGIECGTYVSINRGTSKRSCFNGWGDTSMPSVAFANLGTSRPG